MSQQFLRISLAMTTSCLHLPVPKLASTKVTLESFETFSCEPFKKQIAVMWIYKYSVLRKINERN